MKFKQIQDIINNADKSIAKKQEVAIHGWIWRERNISDLKFIVLRDSSNHIQCIIDKAKTPELFDLVKNLRIETSMEIFGKLRKEAKAPNSYEIDVTKVNIIGRCDNFPIAKDFSPEFLMSVRHLWLRSRKMNAILKIRSTIFGAIHDYFRKNKFYEYHSPIFQGMQAEGGSTLFKVDYFGKPIYLSQTWQLYAEAAIFSLENIYTISPCFRAEKSKTNRHLTELWMCEMEQAWCEFDDIIDHGTKLLKHVVKKVLDTNMPELEILKRDTKTLKATVDNDFIKMTYDDALKILAEKCNMKVKWGKDLRTIEEEKLTKLYNVPIVVINYPKQVKAFYMKEVPGNPDVVQGCDFLAPEGYGEIIGGSQREEDLEKIKERLIDQGEDPKDYSFYLDLRKYGSVPHGGFGMGVERIIAWICGLDTIKDAIAFPRTMLVSKP